MSCFNSKLGWFLNLLLTFHPFHFKSIRKSYIFILDLSGSPLSQPISLGTGLNASAHYLFLWVLIFWLPLWHPLRGHHCGCCERERWSCFCNLHRTWSSHSLIWWKRPFCIILQTFCDFAPASFSDSSLVTPLYENSLLQLYWTACPFSNIPWIFTALQVASTVGHCYQHIPNSIPKNTTHSSSSTYIFL